MPVKFLVVLLILCAPSVFARGTYQTPEDFISETFKQAPPAPQTLWINDAVQDEIGTILGHPLNRLRLVYWANAGRSAWILDEIGKDQPITAGLVVNQGKLENIKVLIYRESRGWEIRHDFFTRQFKGASLTSGIELDRNIDNISGATLSVRALKKLARLALYLDKTYAHP